METALLKLPRHEHPRHPDGLISTETIRMSGVLAPARAAGVNWQDNASAPDILMVPNIAEFTPKALAAFAGLSPSEHSSGTSVRRPGRISRVGSPRLRSILYMCALSAKRTNKALADFVRRMADAGKAPKVILVAVARKLLVYAHAVIRTQRPFQPFPDAPSSI